MPFFRQKLEGSAVLVIETLLEAADQYPKRVAAIDPTTTVSYANLLRWSAVMRREIEHHTSCQRIGLMLPSCAAFEACFYGALWAGRTVVPLNFLLHPSELADVVRDAGIDVILTIRHFEELAQSLPARKVFVDDLPLKRRIILQHLRRTPPLPKVAPEETAVILYTSGTAGVPKGVCLSHHNLRSNTDACIEHAKLSGEHRFLGMLPLFHTFGLTAMLIVPARLGATVVYLPRFQPAGVCHVIRNHRISVVMAIASMYAAMLRVKDASPEDMISVEYAISGGEALPSNVYAGFKDRFGVTLVQGYGLTETSPVVSIDLPWSHQVGTVGRALPGVRVSVRDDNGGALGPDLPGELWVKGANVMQGYYNKPAETAAVLDRDGWFHTGDMGEVDAEGYIRITGRKKELIIVGGENVYPREIESVLDEHPAVAESSVVGEMDSTRGETVVGFVLLKPGASATDLELREFCRGRLAGYKVPRRIMIRDDLPRGPTGKVLKRRLRDFL
jgi:long-chain acyl-CoA synthetase